MESIRTLRELDRLWVFEDHLTPLPTTLGLLTLPNSVTPSLPQPSCPLDLSSGITV